MAFDFIGAMTSTLKVLLEQQERLYQRSDQIEHLELELAEHFYQYEGYYESSEFRERRYEDLGNRVKMMREQNRYLQRLTNTQLERYIQAQNEIIRELEDSCVPRTCVPSWEYCEMPAQEQVIRDCYLRPSFLQDLQDQADAQALELLERKRVLKELQNRNKAEADKLFVSKQSTQAVLRDIWDDCGTYYFEPNFNAFSWRDCETQQMMSTTVHVKRQAVNTSSNKSDTKAIQYEYHCNTDQLPALEQAYDVDSILPPQKENNTSATKAQKSEIGSSSRVSNNVMKEAHSEQSECTHGNTQVRYDCMVSKHQKPEVHGDSSVTKNKKPEVSNNPKLSQHQTPKNRDERSVKRSEPEIRGNSKPENQKARSKLSLNEQGKSNAGEMKHKKSKSSNQQSGTVVPSETKVEIHVSAPPNHNNTSGTESRAQSVFRQKMEDKSSSSKLKIPVLTNLSPSKNQRLMGHGGHQKMPSSPVNVQVLESKLLRVTLKPSPNGLSAAKDTNQSPEVAESKTSAVDKVKYTSVVKEMKQNSELGEKIINGLKRNLERHGNSSQSTTPTSSEVPKFDNLAQKSDNEAHYKQFQRVLTRDSKSPQTPSRRPEKLNLHSLRDDSDETSLQPKIKTRPSSAGSSRATNRVKSNPLVSPRSTLSSPRSFRNPYSPKSPRSPKTFAIPFLPPGSPRSPISPRKLEGKKYLYTEDKKDNILNNVKKRIQSEKSFSIVSDYQKNWGL